MQNLENVRCYKTINKYQNVFIVFKTPWKSDYSLQNGKWVLTLNPIGLKLIYKMIRGWF